MLAEFAQFVQETMPSVTPAAAKKLLAAAGVTGMVDEMYFAKQLGDRLNQGDVVADLRWVVEGEDGRYAIARAPGLLLSHSCDVDNGASLVFAPCQPFNGRAGNASAVMRNEIFDVYYLPAHHGRPARVADLSRIQSMRRDRIDAGLQSGELQRIDSLTQLGYYHFIAKLTIHFMRPQAADEVRLACDSPLADRVLYATRAAVGLTRYVLKGESV